MTVVVSKTLGPIRVEGAQMRWQFARLGTITGKLIENSVDPSDENGGGYATLAELLADVKARFPDEEIIGIGGDEPEAEGLSW
jgi:hypothetical protein